MEETNSVGFTKILTLSDFNPYMSQLALKWSAKIDWGHYVGNELPFHGYNIYTGAVPDIVATQLTKRSKVSGEIMLEATTREVAWLKMTSYASAESKELELERLND